MLSHVVSPIILKLLPLITPCKINRTAFLFICSLFCVKILIVRAFYVAFCTTPRDIYLRRLHAVYLCLLCLSCAHALEVLRRCHVLRLAVLSRFRQDNSTTTMLAITITPARGNGIFYRSRFFWRGFFC